ncbi:MAG TPA: hypothetical protein VEE83_02685 [Thermoplasmata archaeon]|nr:hypothetical protein [Thermoplasmata archaeon]
MSSSHGIGTASSCAGELRLWDRRRKVVRAAGSRAVGNGYESGMARADVLSMSRCATTTGF